MTKRTKVLIAAIPLVLLGLVIYLVPGFFIENSNVPYWLGGPRTVVVGEGDVPNLPNGHYRIWLDRKTHKTQLCMYAPQLPTPFCREIQ
jgi:hypothetical protein